MSSSRTSDAGRSRRDLFGNSRRVGNDRRSYDYGAGLEDDEEDGGDEREAFIKRHMRLQQQERKKQDQNLDELHQSVHRLGEISLEIGNELDEQNKMLEALGDDIDRSQGAMDNIAKKTRELVEMGEDRDIAVLL